MPRTPILLETKQIIEATCNSNFHFDSLDWTTKVWIAKMADVMDDRIEELNDRIKELER